MLSDRPAPVNLPPRLSGQFSSYQFSMDPMLNEMLNAVPDIVLVFNLEKRVVYANRGLANFLHLSVPETVYGMRHGDLFDCVHASEPAGCGGTETCKTCGAATALESGLLGKSDMQECRILQKKPGDALDLRVWSQPLMVNDQRFIIMTVADISHEKRRRALERTFFHDILNTAGGLQGIAEMLMDNIGEDMADIRMLLLRVSEHLVEEIQAQREILAAENDDLQVCPELVYPRAMLQDMIDQYRLLNIAQGRCLQLDEKTTHQDMVSDPILLRRVLGNLVKNALEATPLGGTITLGCDAQGPGMQFWVNNPGCMSPNVQLQVFQRSFSTKGVGRGLGTYSIKLLTERYLQGEVFFSSNPVDGTTFFAIYPVQLEPFS